MLSLSLALAVATAGGCTPAHGDAAAILARAADVTGLSRAATLVLRVNATDLVQHDYESDRTYPPFLVQASRLTEWYLPSSGADRITTSESMIGGSQPRPSTSLGGRVNAYSVRDTTLNVNGALYSQLRTTRPLNVWALLGDWMAAGDARVVARCEYRDYPRLVLAHTGPFGEERLYVDPRNGIPVSLTRTEPQYLWGQTSVEFVYSNWVAVRDAHLPGAAYRMVDGSAEVTRTFGAMGLIPRDSAPPLDMPVAATPMTPTLDAFIAPVAPDTVRVGASTFLLRNPGYTEVVTLARDTVFILDATQGDSRAQQDSVWIGKLFPGRHSIAVVVTDLAWPHVAGVRYWVAQGATIISHRASREFLSRVIARRWTVSPDTLERHRKRAVLHFVPVTDSLALAGGAIKLFAIDGLSSEGALAAFVRQDQFLWASDYIQTLSRPTQYLSDVVSAVRRNHVEPVKVAAEHLPLADWQRAAALAPLPQ